MTETRKLSLAAAHAAQTEPDLLQELVWRLNAEMPVLPPLPDGFKYRFDASYANGTLTMKAIPERIIYVAEEDESV